MNFASRVAWVVWLPALLVTGWEFLSSVGILDPLLFPRPTTVALAGLAMLRSGELTTAVGDTLVNMALGYILGCSTGLACGLAMGRSPALRRTMEAPIAALYSTPKLSLFPLLLLLLGVNDAPRILVVAIACFIVLAFHGQDAAGASTEVYREVGVVYGADASALFRKVYFPAALPTLFTGLRLAVGRAMVVAISVEMVSSTNGIGGLIWLSWQSMAVEKLFVGVATAGLLGALFHLSLVRLQRRVIPWKPTAAH